MLNRIRGFQNLKRTDKDSPRWRIEDRCSCRQKKKSMLKNPLKAQIAYKRTHSHIHVYTNICSHCVNVFWPNEYLLHIP